MTGFLVGAALAVALVLVLLLRPFLGKNIAVQASQRQLNAAIFREELAKLDQDLAEGTLAREDHAQARAELQRRALEDTREADAATTMRAPRRTMVTVALIVPLLAGGLYLMLGNPASMSAQVDPHVQQQDLERLVGSLAKKLEKEPDNLQGWAMLARSYKVLGRMTEAELAFERAGSFIDNDAQMLANYADVAASNAGGSLKGKPAQLIAKALKADPENPMALWLSGTEALERQDFDGALATWDRLMALLPPGSEDANMLQGAIAEVRSRAGKPLTAAAAPAAGEPQAAAPGGGSITGTVEMAAALKDKAAPGDTVMVIARLPGSRVPVAVVRASASQLPVKFTLDDSVSMNPQSRLSAAKEVEVEARVSKSGMAQAAAGDLISSVQTVKVGARDVTLQVGKVRQ
jgi:cytochrome c-type biogenesis protein CcmH